MTVPRYLLAAAGVALLLCVQHALCFPTGAPDGVCDTMLPGHTPNQPQTWPITSELRVSESDMEFTNNQQVWSNETSV